MSYRQDEDGKWCKVDREPHDKIEGLYGFIGFMLAMLLFLLYIFFPR